MEQNPTRTMPSELVAPWRDYLEGVAGKHRKAVAAATQRLIETVAALPPEKRQAFALALVDRERRRRSGGYSLRRDLFYASILPVLVERHDNRQPGAARDLVVFLAYLDGAKSVVNVVGDRDFARYTLLGEAMQEDPDDVELKHLWLSKQVNGFHYTFHDVPYGVLLSDRSRAVAECGELLTELDAFERVALEVGRGEVYRERIAKWRHYSAGYREYLLNRDKYEWFGAYLEQHPLT